MIYHNHNNNNDKSGVITIITTAAAATTNDNNDHDNDNDKTNDMEPSGAALKGWDLLWLRSPKTTEIYFCLLGGLAPSAYSTISFQHLIFICGLDPGSFNFDTVRKNKQIICF